MKTFLTSVLARKKAVILPVIILLLLAFIPRALSTGNTIYYVSPDGVDGASGGQSDPWRTVQYGFNQFQPGDTLIIQEGAYPERVTTTVSGTAGAYLNVIGQNASILNLIFTQSYYDVSGLRIASASDDAVQIRPTANFVSLHDSEITGAGFGVNIWPENSASPAAGPNNITIGPNNVIHDNAQDGILARPNQNSGTYDHRNRIVGNTIYNNADGIDFRKLVGGEITGNVVRNNRSTGVSCDFGSYVVPDDMGATISGNTIYDNASYQLQLRYYCNGITVSGNYVYETARRSGYGIIVSHNAVNNRVIRNVVRNAGTTGSIAVVDGSNNALVAHNIVDGSQGGFGLFAGNPLAGDGITIANNIVMNMTYGYYGVGLTNSVVDANLYYNVSRYYDTGPNTLIGNPSLALTGIIPDEYYQLTAGSIAIDAGLNVGLEYEGVAPDIGPYEYTGSPVPSPTPSLTPTPEPTVEPTPTPTPEPTATAVPTATPTATPTPTPSPTPPPGCTPL